MTTCGFVQESRYAHPDLCHEDVLETESPFATVVAAGTAVYSFLVVGDQNAGKSTFLHAWSASADKAFLSLTSWLPFLSASFVNSRVLSSAGPRSSLGPGDQPPFLDTDLGRASLLVTLETFAFFVAEFGLDPALVTDLDAADRYVAIQFVEIGGDHLDRIMTSDDELAAAPEPGLLELVATSRAMLSSVASAVYFVNGAEWAESPDAAAAALRSRLQYLDGLYAGHEAALELMICITRVELGSDAASQVRDQVVELVAGDDAAPRGGLAFGPLWLCAHIDAGGDLVPDQIMLTLSRLFRAATFAPPDSAVAVGSLDGVTARCLAQCYKDTVAAAAGENGDGFWPFLDRDSFDDWMDDRPVGELPPPLLLQSFDRVFERLAADARVAVIESCDGLGSLSVAVAGHGHWASPLCDRRPGAGLAGRFPLYAPLMEQFEFFMERNLPPQFWYTAPGAKPSQSETAASAPALVAAGLRTRIIDALTAALAPSTHHARLFVWLLEDYALLAAHANAAAIGPLSLPVTVCHVGAVLEAAGLVADDGSRLLCVELDVEE
ncbi:uncharacterized protein AMSG_03786 [Thecamonas trahens ATCC 50062]|uniref:Uncharacterized protein n=1 Tax=Thecamonas trahens ATCC 50062 TaxID=461836 RepID=A0A0L0D4R0_THETB|nr:hypothetical protein AMSG_03786 [Thecamonas trahens ATCC 50062]KNC47352.1 hypothetical protein AMSG_03786 [Thecamonas trahens ATCC 50062]|eukprot:XP_013759690.1 hypothetical protein AMSG_03786 [Thecamonas trahens ATCC 50062]